MSTSLAGGNIRRRNVGYKNLFAHFSSPEELHSRRLHFCSIGNWKVFKMLEKSDKAFTANGSWAANGTRGEKNGEARQLPVTLLSGFLVCAEFLAHKT